jgi:hypothetical protein
MPYWKAPVVPSARSDRQRARIVRPTPCCPAGWVPLGARPVGSIAPRYHVAVASGVAHTRSPPSAEPRVAAQWSQRVVTTAMWHAGTLDRSVQCNPPVCVIVSCKLSPTSRSCLRQATGEALPRFRSSCRRPFLHADSWFVVGPDVGAPGQEHAVICTTLAHLCARCRSGLAPAVSDLRQIRQAAGQSQQNDEQDEVTAQTLQDFSQGWACGRPAAGSSSRAQEYIAWPSACARR